MWNIITSNRLLDKKRKQEAQRKHLAALKNIKSSLNNTEPSTYQFLYSRPKAKLMKLQKQESIQHSNNILVQKMISLSTINHSKDVYIKDSLNVSFNKRKQRQIDLQNQKLVRRLRNVNSSYGQSSSSMSHFSNSYKQAKSNLSKSRALSTVLYDLQMPSKKGSVTKIRPNQKIYAGFAANESKFKRRDRLYSAKTRPYSAKV